jgi:hypothetical protein
MQKKKVKMRISNNMNSTPKSSKVYLLQDIPIDRETGQPKYNIMGARKYGEIVIMFRALEQIMLRDNGLGDIVKNNITVSFGQGEDNKAVGYASLARSNGFEPIQEEKVHPSTLKVVMKEWKDKGHEVPEELFSTFDGNQTHFKNKK